MSRSSDIPFPPPRRPSAGAPVALARPAPFLAAVLAAPLLAAAVSFAGCSGSPDFVLRPVPPGPAAPPFPVTLRALHTGDAGEDTSQQAVVARALADEARARPSDLLLHAGDNLYECGPDATLPGAATCAFSPDGNTVPPTATPDDPRFRKLLEAALEPVQRDGKPVPAYLVLGNHDIASWGTCSGGVDPAVLSRTKACLEVAHRGPQWNLPGRHYVLDRGPVRFIAIDSNLLKQDYGGFRIEDEEAFVREASAPCGERLCFLVGHHPPASGGEHRGDGTPEYLARVKRIESASGGKLSGWLAGHEHQLEHLRTGAGYDVLVSGNGARGRPKERFAAVSDPSARLLFASTSWGFGVLEVGDGRWSYRFVNTRGEPIHCCAATGRGPCEPVACKP